MWHCLEKGLSIELNEGIRVGSNAVWLVTFLTKRGNVDTEAERQTWTQGAAPCGNGGRDHIQMTQSKTSTPETPADQQKLGDPSQPQKEKQHLINACISASVLGKPAILSDSVCGTLALAQAFGIRQVKPRRYVDMHSSLQFWKITILHFTRPPILLPILWDYLVCWQHGGRGESYFRLTSVPFGMAEMNMVSSAPGHQSLQTTVFYFFILMGLLQV